MHDKAIGRMSQCCHDVFIPSIKIRYRRIEGKILPYRIAHFKASARPIRGNSGRDRTGTKMNSEILVFNPYAALTVP